MRGGGAARAGRREWPCWEQVRQGRQAGRARRGQTRAQALGRTPPGARCRKAVGEQRQQPRGRTDSC